MSPDAISAVAEFLGISEEELLEQHDNYLEHQLTRWQHLAPVQESDLAEYYNDNLYLYELVSAPSFGLVRLVQPFLNPVSSIMDYGSGIGTHGLHFLRRGHRLSFVDVPSPHFDFVRWSAARMGGAADFIQQSDVDTLPAQSFDAIFCFDVLEHVADWRMAIAMFARLLKPQGKLFLVVSFREFENHAIHIASRTGLTEDTFQECITQSGFFEIFLRERPVPLTHPLEPFKVFALRRDPRITRLATLYPAGNEYLHRGALAEAESCFSELVAWNPEDFAAHRELARISLQRGEFEKATAQVAHALELLPDDVLAWELSGEINLAAGNLPAAASKFVVALTRWPDLALTARRQLVPLIDDNMLFTAIWTQLKTWRERQTLLAFLIGCGAHVRAREVAKYLTEEHEPDTYAGFIVWKEYARLLRESGRVDEAFVTLRKLLELHPHRPWLHFDMSLCHSVLGEYQAALDELDLEEARTPSRALVLLEKGRVQRSQGNHRSAAILFGEAATVMPEFVAAQLDCARALSEDGDAAGALEEYEKYVELVPDDAQAFFELSHLRLRLGDLAGACTDLTRTIALRHDDAEAWFSLGQVHVATNRRLAAVTAYYRAYQLAPSDMWPRFSFRLKLVLMILDLPACIGFKRLSAR